MAYVQRPLVLLQRGRPYQIRAGLAFDLDRFSRPVGKQRGNNSKRIDFVTQTFEIDLFRTQNFIYVFHGHET